MKTLTFHHRYLWDAVYLDDTLVYWGESVVRSTLLLNALGYHVIHGIEIPTHNLPPEFSGWTADKHPPKSLSVLQKQIAAWKERERREKIEQLRRELERLEKKEG